MLVFRMADGEPPRRLALALGLTYHASPAGVSPAAKTNLFTKIYVLKKQQSVRK
ncbi:hypothetical protein JOC86_003551 [Bacillus pakistanensis]|uniref:Uncharacterized protein n=1 Tax=Rossellomorea pakistanensis TaxID=992288 RepID=A0ABS2NGV2_9BACI|nr:hypothetical protein [Bacillus pakistanensis]MBM7586999.1 hypothetical protein [Bacillus pakistanensis]